ncbi:MAG: S41 family peptidase, partial [Pseudomonadota bacterium]
TMRPLTSRIILPGLLLTLCFSASSQAQEQNALVVFDEAVALVEERFYDPTLNGINWDRAVRLSRSRLGPDTDREALAAELNGLLDQLGASHTQFLTRDDPRWYQLVGVFIDGYQPLQEALDPYLSNGAPVFSGVGLMLEHYETGHFVVGVLDGSPAQAAGILVGDRMVAADGSPFHPIRSFAGKDGRTVAVTLERAPGDRLELNVVPELMDGRQMFEDALRKSVRIIETDGLAIGYLRAWSYAGRRYQDIVSRELVNGTLKDADAFILDIRGGWGGADPSYLNLFSDSSIVASSINRDGEETRFATGWSRPVVLLADEGSRSGKELLAFGFRALSKGPIVGERTAGAVLAGQINALSDGSVLYLAVTDVRVNGERLEGVGVPPDIEVPFDPRYAAGSDPQLDRAVEEATKLVRAE